MTPRTCPDCRTDVPAGSEVAGGTCPSCGAALPPVMATPVMATPVMATPVMATPVAEPSPVPTFDARPYQAVYGATGTGIVIMMVAGLVAAAVVGVLASVVGQFFYLIFLFPFLIGLGVGFPMAHAGKLAKVHSTPVAVLVGLWCGIVAMLVMHYTDFLRFTMNLPGLDISFLDFMDFQATAGVEIGRSGGINLGYTGSVIYWLVEVGVVAAVVSGLGVLQAEAPFCVACDRWKTTREFGPFFADEVTAKEFVESGRAGELADLPETPDKLKLIVAACPDCASDGEIDVKLIKFKKTKDAEAPADVCHVTYPGEAIRVIRATLEPDAG